MREKIFRGSLLLLVTAVMAFAAWMLWPRSLGTAIDWESDLSAAIITSGAEVVDMSSQPYHNIEEYAIEAGSPEAAALRVILSRYAYHLCWDSLSGETGIQGIGSVTMEIYDPQGNGLTVHNGNGKLFLHGQVVRTGYFGSGAASALCEELTAVLRGG